MKLTALFSVLMCLVGPAVGVKVLLRGSVKVPGTISQVVNFLQTLLDKSKKEGDNERELYAKFKCYCDDNSRAKKRSVEDLTQQIGLLESQVEGIQASNGVLTLSVAELQKSMDANAEARATADVLRKKEHVVFVAEEADLKSAIGQVKQAIEILSAVGADQTLQSSAEHTKYVAGHISPSLVKLRSSVSQALLAASAFLSPDLQRRAVEFLQMGAPFDSVYVANSGGVVGILKEMRDTFESNLASAQQNEQVAAKAHTAYMATRQSEWDTMKAASDTKQSTLSTNDQELATKRTQLASAEKQKADDEAILAQLQTSCSAKAKDFDKRVALRLEEQAALSQAIAILNSDQAFDTFGKVAATKTGATSLLQVSVSEDPDGTSAAKRRLQAAFAQTKSGRLARVVSFLATGHPFTEVFAAIEKMKNIIKEEAEQDLEQKTWCEGERSTMNSNLEVAGGQITELSNAITSLEQTINDPETGLLKTIADGETVLEENSKAQKEETAVRRSENKDYQKNIASCVEAAALLKKAIKVLKAYYKKREGELVQGAGFVQRRKDPSPPDTWSGEYVGQSEGGNSVITVLEFILSETGKEEAAAHQTERDAQAAYEDSMQTLKQEEKDVSESLVSKREQLASARLALEHKKSDLTKTQEEKASILQYLEKIKPGCDFITDNYAKREDNRVAETAALDEAVKLLKQTPVYTAAMSREEELRLGECAAVCKADADAVHCKACLAKVTVPGYCAGHPDTKGC